MERVTPSTEPLVYLFLYVCQMPPKKEPSYKMMKELRLPFTEPQADVKRTYNGVLPGSAKCC